MTRFPDPPGEDHERTAAIVRQEREAARREQWIEEQANDLVTAARLAHTDEIQVLRYLAENHEDDDVWGRAMEMVLEDVRTMARGRAA